MAIKHTNFDKLQEERKTGSSSKKYTVNGKTYNVVNVDKE